MTSKKGLLLLLLVIVVTVFFALGGVHYLTLEQLKSSYQQLLDLRTASPWLLATGFFISYVGVTALSLPGLTILSLAGGALFGFWIGVLLVSFAVSIGATLALLLARHLLRAPLQRYFASQLDAINAGIAAHGALYLFCLRLTPLLPFVLVNLLMGITNIRPFTFYWVGQLGMLANVTIFVNAGTQLAQIHKLDDIFSPDVLLSLTLLALLAVLAKPVAQWGQRLLGTGHGIKSGRVGNDGQHVGCTLSIIAPVLNEAANLPHWLAHLTTLREQGAEIIIVDGGSQDASVTIAREWGARVIVAERSRARQMNAGAAVAGGDVLLFLHADTTLPEGVFQQLATVFACSDRVWGRFAVTIVGRPWMLRLVAFMINQRSCLTGIATGDQAMFMTRWAFIMVGGFPDLPLMEDITLSQRLLTLSRPICLAMRVTTSGRRWERHGIWRTIWLMWRLRWSYWHGVPASDLAKLYRSP